MGEWINDWRDKCSSVSKMMAVLSLLLCDPSACSGELLSPRSSDCNLVGVIYRDEETCKVIDFIFLAYMNYEKRKGKKGFQTFLRGLLPNEVGLPLWHIFDRAQINPRPFAMVPLEDALQFLPSFKASFRLNGLGVLAKDSLLAMVPAKIWAWDLTFQII